MNKNSLISIIIPTYNRAHLIGETLDSIMAQTYTNWECIVVDDGSTDNTEKLILKYVEKDVRFQYHMCPKDRLQGGNAARNYGFEISRGDYVNWFDSDDLMHSEKLQLNVNEFNKNPNIDFCLSNSSTFGSNIISEELKINSTNDLFNNYILKINKFNTNTPLFKKNFLNDKKLFNESTLRGQEYEFFSSLFYNYSRPIGFINKFLVFIRIENESGITNDYFKGNSKKFDSYFNVLKGVFLKIQDKHILLDFLIYTYKELFYAVKTAHYLPVYKHIIFMWFNITKSKLKFSIMISLLYVLKVQTFRGKFYYKSKNKIFKMLNNSLRD